MSTTTNRNPATGAFTTATISGKQVKVATKAAAIASASKIKIKYARTLENLKNR